MEPQQIESLLMMVTVIFVAMIVMLTVNEFGANAMTLILSSILLSGLLQKNQMVMADPLLGLGGMAAHDSDPAVGLGGTGGLIGMSLFDLDAYYDHIKEKLQFPGWSNQRDATGHVSDIMVRAVTTIVLLCFFVKSGIFKVENFNPIKRLMMN
jgi:hypothetical protein